MFKSFQNTSALQQFHGFPNLNMQQATSAYGFSGVTFWLDAAYGLNTQTDLGAVSSWQARVGGLTFVQATAGSQPRLVLSDANFNNLPSIQFQDGARNLILSNTFLPLNRNFTIVFVAKYDTLNLNNTLLSNATLTLPDATNFMIGGTSTFGVNGFCFFDGIANTIRSGTTENTDAKIGIFTNERIYVDGIQEATYTTEIGTLSFTVLGRRQANNEGLIGRIAEILVFQRTFSTVELSALSNNINQKYALY